MNALRTRLGIIYVAALVLVIISIPALREAKHLNSVQTWPAGATTANHSFSG